MAEKDAEIASVVRRERSRLGRFIRRRVLNPADAEDILQDVFHDFVQVYRLSATVEQAGAWLYRVARNRIIDRFRKKREQSANEPAARSEDDADAAEYQLDLALPSPHGGPEAEYARSRLLTALQQAIEELPREQRDVFLAHELEGRSFKEMAVQLGIPVNTLLARKRYAVLQLRKRLQTTYDELDL
jgi:RNA polymerase sigma factor (sigma-70 family)